MAVPAIAEVLVPLPHLVAVDRLPEALTIGRLAVELTGGSRGLDVVGTLRAHAAEAIWHVGRRHGSARYEVMRSHVDRCLLTVVLDGLDRTAAQAVADEARRRILAVRAQASTPMATPVAAPLSARLA